MKKKNLDILAISFFGQNPPEKYIFFRKWPWAKKAVVMGRLWPPLGTLNPVWGTKMAYKRKILPISWRDFSDLLYINLADPAKIANGDEQGNRFNPQELAYNPLGPC